jgi:protein arginine kinase
VLHKEFDALVADLRGRQLALRGFRGEGSAAHGYFFQISNAVTLGVREGEILKKLHQAAGDLVAREERARTALLARARTLLEDKIWRAYGVLRHARMLAAREALNHVSLLRLGTSVGLLHVPVQALNEILIHSQPAHAQLLGSATEPAATDAWRAEMIRKKLRECES